MKFVGIMIAFGLFAVMRVGVSIFARHPLIEKLRQNEVYESEQRYRALFENAPMGMAVTTRDGKILAHNGAMAKMLDCKKSSTRVCSKKLCCGTPEKGGSQESHDGESRRARD